MPTKGVEPGLRPTSLRVGMLAPISWRVPPRHYGPWERFVSLLTEGLVARGVDVTLFASADSETSARLVATAPRGYSEDPSLDPKVWESLHISTAFEHAGDFDLIHNSADFLPLTYAPLVSTPLVTTIHGFSSQRILPVYERYDGRCHYVAISDADRHPRLHYVATIHHGVDPSEFTFRPEPGDYLLFFGRIHEDKGTVEAIRVARAAGLPLVIAGIVHDEGYFEREVEPRIDGEWVRYAGSVGPAKRDALLGGAKALLHLVNFEEPFGLSVIEAMACGTPVIASARGSMPEIVRDGVNGFLVRSVEEAVSAAAAVGTIDRMAVRKDMEARFRHELMVDRYLRVYQAIVAGRANARAGRR